MAGEEKGLALLFGSGKPKSSGGGSSSDSDDMACKALFKAIKGDDYDGFKEALDLYLESRDEPAEPAKTDDE